MATKKTTQQIIESWPDYKQKGFAEIWLFNWRSGSNKRKAVEAFDQWVTQENIHEVVEGARIYTNRMRGNAYIKSTAPWLNGESWHDDPPPERRDETEPYVSTEICRVCGEPATVRKPEVLCSRCYISSYSTQLCDGERLPYQFVLAKALKDAGLEIREGETEDAWQDRCKQHAFKKIGRVLQQHAPRQKTQGDVAKRTRDV